jgi:hypothetical protein
MRVSFLVVIPMVLVACGQPPQCVAGAVSWRPDESHAARRPVRQLYAEMHVVSEEANCAERLAAHAQSMERRYTGISQILAALGAMLTALATALLAVRGSPAPAPGRSKWLTHVNPATVTAIIAAVVACGSGVVSAIRSSDGNTVNVSEWTAAATMMREAATTARANSLQLEGQSEPDARARELRKELMARRQQVPTLLAPEGFVQGLQDARRRATEEAAREFHL